MRFRLPSRKKNKAQFCIRFDFRPKKEYNWHFSPYGAVKRLTRPHSC